MEGRIHLAPPLCIVARPAAPYPLTITQTELQGVKEPDFGSFADALFEDVDFETLFDPAYDGIEDSEIGKMMGIANLAFKDWFKRFGSDKHSAYTEIHPFAQPDRD